jgi:hypothetical protein
LQEMKTETNEINNKKKSHAYISYTKWNKKSIAYAFSGNANVKEEYMINKMVGHALHTIEWFVLGRM